MWEYLRRHEDFVGRALAGEYGQIDLAELHEFHERQLGRMQHERLIHLIVTLSVAAFALMTAGFVAARFSWPATTLLALLLILASAYVVHYFRLENGVQRWYHLGNRIEGRLARLSADYQGNTTTVSGTSDGPR